MAAGGLEVRRVETAGDARRRAAARSGGGGVDVSVQDGEDCVSTERAGGRRPQEATAAAAAAAVAAAAAADARARQASRSHPMSACKAAGGRKAREPTPRGHHLLGRPRKDRSLSRSPARGCDVVAEQKLHGEAPRVGIRGHAGSTPISRDLAPAPSLLSAVQRRAESDRRLDASRALPALFAFWLRSSRQLWSPRNPPPGESACAVSVLAAAGAGRAYTGGARRCRRRPSRFRLRAQVPPALAGPAPSSHASILLPYCCR